MGRRLGVLAWVANDNHAYALEAVVGDALVLGRKRDEAEAPWLSSVVGVGKRKSARGSHMTAKARAAADAAPVRADAEAERAREEMDPPTRLAVAAVDAALLAHHRCETETRSRATRVAAETSPLESHEGDVRARASDLARIVGAEGADLLEGRARRAPSPRHS